MFEDCKSLESLNLPSFNKENLRDMQNMFHGCYKLKEFHDENNGNNEITMIYKINKEEEEIKILCEDFVEENKGKCKLIINKKEYDLCEKIKYDKYGINKEDDLLTVILVENKNEKITKYAFYV